MAEVHITIIAIVITIIIFIAISLITAWKRRTRAEYNTGAADRRCSRKVDRAAP